MGSGGKRTRDEEHEGKEGCLNKGWNGGRYEIFPNFLFIFIPGFLFVTAGQAIRVN